MQDKARVPGFKIIYTILMIIINRYFPNTFYSPDCVRATQGMQNDNEVEVSSCIKHGDQCSLDNQSQALNSR